MRTIYRDIVAILLFSKDGRLFQGRRNPAHGGVWPDCWNIPGGGVEKNERKEDAVRRETLEETGIDIAAYPLELIDDRGSGSAEKTLRETGERVIVDMKFTVYKVILDQKAEDIEVKLHDEFIEASWSTLKEAVQLKLTPPTVELFKRLGYL